MAERFPIQASDGSERDRTEALLHELTGELQRIENEIRENKSLPKAARKNARLINNKQYLEGYIEECQSHLGKDPEKSFEPDWLDTWKRHVRRPLKRADDYSNDLPYDKDVFDPKRFNSKKEIRNARVLVFDIKRFYSEEHPDILNGQNSGCYEDIRESFVVRFGYEDVLERIMTNMIALNKMDFNNITDEHVERVKIEHKLNVIISDIEHLQTFKEKYKQLNDKLEKTIFYTELLCACDNKENDVPIILQNAYWTNEEMLLMLEILIEDPNNKNVDALILMVCSEGQLMNGETEIIDCKLEPIKVNKIIKMFSTQSVQRHEDLCCLLFFEACRGKKDYKDDTNLVTTGSAVEQESDQSNGANEVDEDCEEGINIAQVSLPVQTEGGNESSMGPVDDTTQMNVGGEGGVSFPVQTEGGDESSMGPVDSIGERLEEMNVVGEGGASSALTIRDEKDGNKYKEGEPLPPASLTDRDPVSLTTTTEELEPLPPLPSLGYCPNNCLVAYSTVRGFYTPTMTDVGPMYLITFADRMRKYDQFALLPFLTLLHRELVYRPPSSDFMTMPTFDHQLTKMPVFMKNKFCSFHATSS